MTSMSAADERRTSSDDGTKIAWSTHGPDQAPAVVMMHSLGSNRMMWRPQIAALETRFRVIAIDTRGHGSSDAPPGPYRLEHLGRDVLNVANDAGADSFHVVGLSLGGQMAMWLAMNAPERVLSAVLANTGAKIGTNESWQERIDTITAGGMTTVRDAVLGRWFTPAFRDEHPDWFAEVKRVFEASDPGGYIGCCAALRDSDLRVTVGAISAPTLVIGGALDLATPPDLAMWLHEHIEGSELTMFDDAAHLSNLERADEFTARLVRFLTAR
jgi:3-oxoadipate enol-lactonase